MFVPLCDTPNQFCKVDFTKCKYLTLFYKIILPCQKKAVLLHREIKN